MSQTSPPKSCLPFEPFGPSLPPPWDDGWTLGCAVVRHSKRSLIPDLVGFNAAMAACDQGQQWAPLMVYNAG